MSEKTTIKVGKDVVSRLIKLKIHSRQSNSANAKSFDTLLKWGIKPHGSGAS
jgi:hypothetical protein